MSEAELAYGDESPLAKIIRDCLGVGDYEQVRCVLPTFERTDSKRITYIPKTKQQFDDLKKAPDDILVDIGMQKWKKNIWLFPFEWYDSIPEGYEIITIMGKIKHFEHGVTDDDMRFGALSFGVCHGDNIEKGGG